MTMTTKPAPLTELTERTGRSALYVKTLADLNQGFEPELVIGLLAIALAADGSDDPDVLAMVKAAKLAMVRGEKDHRMPQNKRPVNVFARALDAAEQIESMRTGAGCRRNADALAAPGAEQPVEADEPPEAPSDPSPTPADVARAGNLPQLPAAPGR
jgi:hypothetical protein